MAKQVTKPGRYADGNGLYLVVDPSGARRWVLRIVVHGRRRDIGLGGLSIVSLKDARELAAQYRRIARDGGDPIAERNKANAVIPTFQDAAAQVHEERKHSWENAKHQSQWINTLKTYANPLIGNKRVDVIDTPDILRVLSPIWLTKSETARRLKQRIATVFDWAKASGFRSGDNPCDGVLKGLPAQRERPKHFAAMPYADIPQFIGMLHGSNNIDQSSYALEFLILSATRTNEVLKAVWSEINIDEALWTIPAERMKARREHRVPLSSRALEVLEQARHISTDDEYIFPGRVIGKPLSNMALLQVMRRKGLDYTIHGFRSSFRDWAEDQTSFSHNVCEMALAHTIKDKAEAAYRRGDLLEKRRELMSAWATFLQDQVTK